jgi:7-cyano-7-deazaguanine synthase
MEKAIVVYSGGMDSYTLLCSTVKDLGKDNVKALSFNYGQRHSKELLYAEAGAKELGIEHKVVDIQGIHDLLGGSALTDEIDVPEGHYAAENMKLTVVPNRNMIMLSIATAYAVSSNFDTVLFGAHSGDHTIYPDCRREFVEALSAATMIANYLPVTIEAPYLDMHKGDIAAIGKGIDIDYSKSWTCYKGLDVACGKCGACQERTEAMEFAYAVA